MEQQHTGDNPDKSRRLIQPKLDAFWSQDTNTGNANQPPNQRREYRLRPSKKAKTTNRLTKATMRTRHERNPLEQLLLSQLWSSAASKCQAEGAEKKEPSTTATTPKPAATTAPVGWPHEMAEYQGEYHAPLTFTFETIDPFVFCSCESACRATSCANAQNGTFCTSECCPHEGRCGNGLLVFPKLKLVNRNSSFGYGVYAEEDIQSGVIIGEYLGEFVLLRRGDLPRNRGYLLQMKALAVEHPSSKVYIDAEKRGNLTRFMNHSCRANATFKELCNGPRHAVVVVATKPIPVGHEVKVNYGIHLWFLCECGYTDCCHRDLHSILKESLSLS